MKHFFLLWSLLNKGQRLYFFYIVFLMLTQAILEILSIALVIPFTSLILDPNQQTNLLILAGIFYDHNFLFIKNTFLPNFAFIESKASRSSLGPNLAKTDMIAEAVIGRKLETTGQEVLKTVHPHPTMSEAIMEAVADAYDEVIHL